MKPRPPRKPKPRYRTLESLVRRCCAALQRARARVVLQGGTAIRVEGERPADWYGQVYCCPIVVALDPANGTNADAECLARRKGFTGSAARTVMDAADWPTWNASTRKRTATLRRVRQRLLRAAGRLV